MVAWQFCLYLGKMTTSSSSSPRTAGLRIVQTSKPTARIDTGTHIDELRRLIADDMKSVDQFIQKQLHSEVELINQLGHYIVDSGGKRLRPALLLLCARALGYTGSHHIDLAAVIEFIHTATLLHDDVVDDSTMRRGRETANLLWGNESSVLVVDDSTMRRGRETANLLWGNEASVLVGDFLYSRAFQMMMGIHNMRVMEILSDATNTIAEGEVLQLLNRHDPETTESRYLEVIRNKTAKLFAAAGQLGAVITGRSIKDEEAMAAYGMHVGTAFQLIDDVLDYSASTAELGKNIGDDLAEGKPTLPLLYTLLHGTAKQAATIRKAIVNGGLNRIHEVTDAIESTGAIAYTARLARNEADSAVQYLSNVPASPYKDALYALAEFAVDRTN